ncbi:uncharacterized protein LOC131215685 [Anopheles bellator]|uniref:uncharacterized protein LOC131215685 n=1 Tax=Anopheles bellator TaxID=139047 RepID=UPI002649F1A2|nr:uncharacterized protein LOC131215685 [Anopheles bellator]
MAMNGSVVKMRSKVEASIGPVRCESNNTAAGRRETDQLLAGFGCNMGKQKAKRKPIVPSTLDRAVSQGLGQRIARCFDAVPKDSRRMLQLGTFPPEVGSNEEEADGLLFDLAALKQEVAIEARPKPRPMPERVENWMENFLRKPAPKRIRWRSQLYGTPTEPHPATQVEQLIDVGAQDFVDWLNTLGAERSSITRSIVRQLFSVETGDEMSRALNVAPKEIRAIPGQVAAEWHLPQMSLENRIARVREHDRKSVAGRRERLAFGRGLPKTMRSQVLDSEDSDPGRADVPEDLMSLRRLFKDIWHLRSVKYLIDYFEERPTLPRPPFLVEKGLFQRRDSCASVPFYRKVLPQEAFAASVRK